MYVVVLVYFIHNGLGDISSGGSTNEISQIKGLLMVPNCELLQVDIKGIPSTTASEEEGRGGGGGKGGGKSSERGGERGIRAG